MREVSIYIDAYLIPIRPEMLGEDYAAFSRLVADVYRECGALRVVELRLDADADGGEAFHAEGAREALAEAGPLRDFGQAAAANRDETVLLSWTEWPDKAARDAGLAKALADPRIQPQPGQTAFFEGRRLVAGSFALRMER